MRIVKSVFLALVGFAFFILALANRDPVTLRLLPESLGTSISDLPTVSVPLFLPIFGSVIIGLLIGFFWEWLREHHHRARASASQRQVSRMKKEISTLKRNTTEPDDVPDDVLALIND
ncbi:MAG: LapA family protein [Rhodobacteraceae bacterium]|nr:LapA family protein [Paracoccaceae bacterium]